MVSNKQRRSSETNIRRCQNDENKLEDFTIYLYFSSQFIHLQYSWKIAQIIITNLFNKANKQIQVFLFIHYFNIICRTHGNMWKKKTFLYLLLCYCLSIEFWI